LAITDSQDNAIIDHGEDEAEITLAGAVVIGDAIGWSAGWKRALATVGTAIQLRCVAAQDGATGQKIKAYFGKTLISGTRFSGGVAGAALYVAEGSDNGEYTEAVPTDSGDVTTKIGYTLSANEVIVLPNRVTDSVV